MHDLEQEENTKAMHILWFEYKLWKKLQIILHYEILLWFIQISYYLFGAILLSI